MNYLRLRKSDDGLRMKPFGFVFTLVLVAALSACTAGEHEDSDAGIGAYMDAQENELREQLAGTGVSVVRHGNDIVLNMPGKVTFDVDQANVQSSFYPVLNSVGLVLDEYNQTLIDVNGHTDSTGSLQYNMDLSNRRARSVAAYLGSRGIERGRIYTQGYGPHHPMADNGTAEGRRTNRRVEMVLVAGNRVEIGCGADKNTTLIAESGR